MRRGFVSQLGMDRDAVLQRAEALGFEFVELLMDGDDDRAGVDEAFVDRLRGAPVDVLVHLPWSGFDIGSPHEHVREGAVREYEAYLDLIERFDAEKAVIHGSTGAWRAAWPDGIARERLFESLRHLDGYAADRGIELAVENVPGGALPTTGFDELLSATDANVTLDTGHARIDGLDDDGIVALVEDHRDRITHVHLNDVRGASDEHLPFGAGFVDFEAILGALADREPAPTLSLEVYTLDWGYVETSKRRLDAVLDAVAGGTYGADGADGADGPDGRGGGGTGGVSG
ncbi:MAG: sugar phosphate isomerase/epimerase family protein [Haloarculaceae archaeon]